MIGKAVWALTAATGLTAGAVVYTGVTDADGMSIPPRAIQAYVAAVASPANTCGVTWQDLAAIRHNESPGSIGLEQPDGTVEPKVFGSGIGYFVADTDDGVIDGRPGSDREAGPMQFMPGTAQGVAGRPAVIAALGHELTNPELAVALHDLDVSSIMAVSLLCSNGYEAGSDADSRAMAWAAIKAYNGSGSAATAYADRAISYSDGLPRQVTGVPLPPSVGSTSLARESQDRPAHPAGNLADKVVMGGVDRVNEVAPLVDAGSPGWMGDWFEPLREKANELVADPSTSPTPLSPSSTSAPVQVGAFALPVDRGLLTAEMVGRPHHDYPALDLPVSSGTPVYAVAGGTTSLIDDDLCGIGVAVTIQGWRYVVCHLSEARIGAGATVPAGQLIGLSGNTGHSTGPHLHLGVRRPDGNWACPQSLVGGLLDGRVPVPESLPTSGCTSGSLP